MNGSPGASGSPGPSGSPGTTGSPAPTPAPLQGGFSLASTATILGETVDTHGNLWLLSFDYSANTDGVAEYAAGSITATPGRFSNPTPTLTATLNVPVFAQSLGFAVDASGDAFLGAGGSFIPSGTMYAFAGPINSGASPTASTTVATGEPDHIAVDGSGTLYVINTGLETFTYAGGVLTAGSAVSSPVVVSPLAVVNDMAGNIVESDNGTGGPPLLNTITARTVTASEQLALASTAGQIAHDPSSGYVYVISRNAASYFLQVYDTSSGTGTSVLPLAVLILSQSGVGNSGIAVDANFVYIAAGNGVTLYPKYSPTSPYSLYRKAR